MLSRNVRIRNRNILVFFFFPLPGSMAEWRGGEGGKKGIDLVFLWGADPCQSTAQPGAKNPYLRYIR